MNKKIKIIENKDYITIEINGKIKGDYPVTDLAYKYPGFDKLSDIIIHWSEKPDYKSQQLRDKILLPLAVLIEKHFPGKINWFETFYLAEGHLYEGENSNFNENGEESDVHDNWSEAIDGVNPFLKEIDNPDNKAFIENYLLENNLPLYTV